VLAFVPREGLSPCHLEASQWLPCLLGSHHSALPSSVPLSMLLSPHHGSHSLDLAHPLISAMLARTSARIRVPKATCRISESLGAHRTQRTGVLTALLCHSQRTGAESAEDRGAWRGVWGEQGPASGDFSQGSDIGNERDNLVTCG
jgi:hypothetical protein